MSETSGWPGTQTHQKRATRGREHLSEFPEEVPYGLVDIADDAEIADQAWAENVPESLGEGDGGRGETGVYGSLDDVDFARQALVVWHGGGVRYVPGLAGRH